MVVYILLKGIDSISDILTLIADKDTTKIETLNNLQIQELCKNKLSQLITEYNSPPTIDFINGNMEFQFKLYSFHIKVGHSFMDIVVKEESFIKFKIL